MNREELREYCLKKKHVTESFPFDETTLVMKVAGKMFLLTDLVDDFAINVKCAPMLGIELRQEYEAVREGYHMNKKHWNTIRIDGTIDKKLILKWIDNSYDLVLSSLPKKIRDTLL